MGVKSPSILSIHPPFDAVKGYAIDSLHCLYLGVTLLLLHQAGNFEIWHRNFMDIS